MSSRVCNLLSLAWELGVIKGLVENLFPGPVFSFFFNAEGAGTINYPKWSVLSTHKKEKDEKLSQVFTVAFASCWKWRFVASPTCLEGDKHEATKGGQRAEQTPVSQCFHSVSRGIWFQQTLSEKCSLQKKTKKQMDFFARFATNVLHQKTQILLNTAFSMRSFGFIGYTWCHFVEYKLRSIKRKWQMVLLTETPRSPLSPRGPLEPGPPCMETEAQSEWGSNSKQIPKALKSWTTRNPHRGLSEVTVQWYSRHETLSAAVFPAGIYLLTLLPEPTSPCMVSSSTSLSKGKENTSPPVWYSLTTQPSPRSESRQVQVVK